MLNFIGNIYFHSTISFLPFRMPRTRSKVDPFDGKEELNCLELATTSLRMHGLLEKAIPEHEEGSTHALPLFFLSENNKRISTASIAVLGTCPLADKRKSLKDLTAEKSTHAIRFPDIPFSSFTFKDHLTSDYLSCQDLIISVVDENGAILDAETRKSVQIPLMSLRMFVVPLSGGSTCKISVMVYPFSDEEMSDDHPLSVDASFPGSLLWSTEAPLGIPVGMVTRKNIGIPILPVFRSAESLRDKGCNIPPRTSDIKYKLSCLMNSKTVPISINTGRALQERYSQIKESGESKVKRTKAAWSWPTLEDPSNKKGKKHFQILVLESLFLVKYRLFNIIVFVSTGLWHFTNIQISSYILLRNHQPPG